MNPEELREFDSLCEVFSSGTNVAETQAAADKLQQFVDSFDNLSKIQACLENTDSPNSRFLAANSLKDLISKHWNRIEPNDKVAMRDYFLKLIQDRKDKLVQNDLSAIILLVCRTTKLLWIESPEDEDFVKAVFAMVDQDLKSHCIALKIFDELINEMNEITRGRTITQHRRAAIAFKNKHMLNVFQISLNSMKESYKAYSEGSMGNNDGVETILELSLKLSYSCLSFDFIAASPDETLEDPAANQLPSSWVDTMINHTNTEIFLSILFSTKTTNFWSLCLKNLGRLASTRRSLFSAEQKDKFFRTIIDGFAMIAQKDYLFTDPEEVFNFTVCLHKLHVNYPLSDLVKNPENSKWLECLAKICASFIVEQSKEPDNNHAVLNYIISIWAKLSGDSSYTKEFNTTIEDCVELVMETYIREQLRNARELEFENYNLNCPLETGSTEINPTVDILDQFPRLFRHSYARNLKKLIPRFQEIMEYYQSITAGNMMSPKEMKARFTEGEGQVAWIIVTSASIVHLRSYQSEEKEALDTELTVNMFRLIKVINDISEQGQFMYSERVELAVLYFLQMFRISYINDPAGYSLSYVNNDDLLISDTHGSKVFHNLASELGCNNFLDIVELVANKAINNLTMWQDSEKVVTSTLRLFESLVTGHNSSRMLLKLDIIQQFISEYNRVQNYLNKPSLYKYRTVLHTVIGKLWFSSEFIENFDANIRVMNEKLNDMLGWDQSLLASNTQAKSEIIKLFRDLQGICKAINISHNYSLIFEAT